MQISWCSLPTAASSAMRTTRRPSGCSTGWPGSEAEFMWTVLRSSLRGHVRRLASIGLAVCIGVAFLSGTLVLGDTLRANFDRLFANAYGRTDVVVRSANTLS